MIKDKKKSGGFLKQKLSFCVDVVVVVVFSFKYASIENRLEIYSDSLPLDPDWKSLTSIENLYS